MTILILNIGDPVFLKTRKQVRPPRRSKLAIYQDERFDTDWDRLIKWDDVSDSPLDVMTTYGIEPLWTGTFDWSDQPQPEFAASDLFDEHFNTGWIFTNVAPEGELVVDGVAEYQQTLTANVGALSDEDVLPDAATYQYQWQHETSPDVFEDISGATSNTYTTDRYDMGKRIRFRLSYTDLLLNDEVVYSTATAVIPFTDIPVEGEPVIQNLTAPGQSAQQGHNLYANVSGISDFNQPLRSGYSYQWFREDALNSGNYVEIAGATSQNYTVQAEDLNPATTPTNTASSRGRIKVRVRYTDSLEKLEEVYSIDYIVVDSPFSGTPTIGLKLLDENGNPTTTTTIFDVNTQASAIVTSFQDGNDPLTNEYQWYAEVFGSPSTFLPISGATAATFNITSEFEKRKLYVRVTTTDASGNVYITQSAQTTRVNDLPSGTPNLVGTYKVGQTLSTNMGNVSDYDMANFGWNSLFFEFQSASSINGPWNVVRARTWGNYTGASLYTIQPADINKYIRVSITYTDSLGKLEEVFSTPQLVVNSSPTGEPVVKATDGGIARVGKTLTADMSGVVDVNTPLGSYSYQWFRRTTNSGAAFTEISGATSSTYVVPVEDGGQDIKVEVSFVDSGGVTETVVSAATSVENSYPTGDMTTIVVEGGDPEAGKTLQVDASGISDVNGVGPLSYQWYSSSKYHHGSTAESPISGATSDSYVIQPADAGKEIFAKVSYTDQFPLASKQETYSLDTRLDAEKYMPDPSGLRCHLDAQLYNVHSREQIEDLSSYKDNGLRYGSYGYDAASGGQFNLGAADYIKLPYNQLKDLGANFTISCYMYINKSQKHCVFSNMDVTAEEWGKTKGLRWRINNGAFWMQSGRGKWDWSGGYATGSAVPSSGYYLVNLVVQGSSAKFYANGTLYGDNTLSAVSGASGNIYFGEIHSDSINIGREFMGTRNGGYHSDYQPINFSYFSVHSRAFSATEIKDMSNAFASRRASQVKPPRFFVNAPATGQPTISGRQSVDAILTSDVSAIADLNGLTTFSYQWLRDGSPISGATSDTYTVQNADFGKDVSLRISYTDRAGYAETPTSDPLAIVNYPPYGPISISNATSPGNAPQVTHVVEADLSQMSDQNVIQPENVTYQWLSNNVEVQNGTGDAFKQYTIQPTDYGQSIVLKVSYTDDAGNVETPEIYGNLTSAGVTVVNSPSTGEVYILNAALEQASQEEQNAIITADPSALRDINEYDDLTPDSFTYQWRRNGSNISGQTGQSYSMQWMDHGDQITVAVSFTDDEGNVETTVSSNSVTLKNSVPTGDVIITGEPRVGKTLTADPSSIEDPNYFGPISNYMDKITSYSSNHSTTGFSSFNGQRTIHHTRDQHHYVITETVYFPEVTRLWRVLSWVGGLYWNTTTIKYIKYLDANDVWQTITGAEANITGASWVARHYGSTSNNPWFAKAVQYQTTNGHGGSNGGRNYLHWYVLTDQTISDAASYQWHRDDGNGPVDIVGATESTYTLVEDDYAKNITCTVSYTDAHGSSESVTSSTPMLVDATGYPSIDGLDADGAAVVGGTLTANLSAMQDVQGFTNLVYHWEAKQLDDADYSVVSTGADQNTFVVPVGYDAAEIRVRVTYDDGDFATSNFVYVRSDVTGDLVMSGPSSPDYYVGDVVLADASSIEDINGLPANDQISYDWYRGATLVSGKTQSTIYEQAITVTSNNTMSNHIVEVVLDTNALYYAGKIHSDSRVHFLDESGNTIPYWFEGPTRSTRSTYWLKMDLPAGSTNIVARYSADASFSGAESDSSEIGFTFFEDFENGLGAWNVFGDEGDITLGSDYLRMTRNGVYLTSDVKFSSPVIVRATTNTKAAGSPGLATIGFWSNASDEVSVINNTDVLYYSNNGAQNSIASHAYRNDYLVDEITLTGTQAQAYRWEGSNSFSTGFFTHTQGNKSLYLGQPPSFSGETGLDAYWYNIHVRPYVAGLSVSVSLGAETSFVGSVYNIASGDSGSDLHVVMSYTDLQGFSESVTSPTITVSNSPFSGAVSISGSPYTGETLTADTSKLADADGIDGSSYTYQWSANGQALAGETASTFAVTNAYVNQAITVEVSFADNTGSPGSATAPGVTILNTPSTGEPVLNGTPSVGEDLTIDMSAVNDVDGPISNVTYAWYESTARNVLASRDTLIAGAESNTFTIPAGYEAKEVKALVSYDDTKGESRSKYAPALPAFPEQDLDFYIDAGSKDSYALGTTDVYDLTQDALAMTVASNEWSNINNGRLSSSTTKRALQNASRLHDLGNDFTISALAYLSLAVDNVFLSCMQYNDNVERYEGYMFYFDEAQNRLSLRLGAPSVTNNNRGVYYFRSGGQITSSGFYLVSVAVQNYNSDNPTVDFFVNGNLSGSRVFGDGAFHSAIYYDLWNQSVRQPLYADVSEPVLIGGMNNTGNVGYDDQNFDIGMLSVHRRALSDAEMAEMYSTFSDRITGSVSRKLIAAPPVGVPTISGTPQAGYTLTADASGVTDANEIPSSFSYAWYADGVQLGTSGPNEVSRTLSANEFNKQITVKVVYSDRAGYGHQVESAPVLVVNTPATGTVAISGTPEVGQELTAVTSALSDVNGKPVSAGGFTYQWYVDDALVAPESKIHALEHFVYNPAASSDLVGRASVDHAFSEDGNRKFYYSGDDNYYVQNRGADGIWGVPQQIATNGYPNRIDNGLLVAISPDGNTLSFSTFDYYGVGFIVLYEEGQSGWEQVYSVAATGLAFSSANVAAGKCLFSADSSVAYIQSGGSVNATTIVKKENGVWTQVEYLEDQVSVLGVANENRFIAIDSEATFRWDIWEYVKTDGVWERTLIPRPPDGSISPFGVSSTGDFEIAATSKVSSDLNTLFLIYRNPYGADTAVVVYRKVGGSYQVSKIASCNLAEEFSRDGLWFTATRYVYHWNGLDWVSADLWYDVAQNIPAVLEMVPDGDTVHILSMHNYSEDPYRVSTISFFTPSYTVQSDDIFKDVKVAVSFTDNAGNAEGPFESPAVSIVNSLPQGTFQIQGGSGDGDLVYVDVSGITDANGIGNDWSYQWKRGNVAIPGETGPEYTIATADLYSDISVDATYTDQKGTREYLSDSLDLVPPASSVFEDFSSYGTGSAITGAWYSNGSGNTIQTASSGRFSGKKFATLKDGNERALTYSQPVYFNGSTSLKLTIVKKTSSGTDFGLGLETADSGEDVALEYSTNGSSWTNYTTFLYGSSSVNYLENYAIPITLVGTYYIRYRQVDHSGTCCDHIAITDLEVPGVAVTAPDPAPAGTAAISGTPGAGYDLSVTLAGDWASATGTFVYQWVLDDEDVFGETNATFTVPVNKIGSQVKVRVGYVHTSGMVSSAESAPVSIVNAPASGQPVISGVYQVGETLTVTQNVSDGDGIDGGVTYTWYRDDVAFQTNNSTYTLALSDVEKTFYVIASYTDSTGNPETIQSNSVFIPNNPPNGSVTIAGLYRAGETLTATVSYTDPEGVQPGSESYQWTRDGQDIAGATALSYELQVADIGALVAMEVRYTDNAGKAETLASTPSAVVGRPPVLDNPLVDQSTHEGFVFNYVVPADAFSDADGHALTYSATLADGSALPSWLSFDPATRTFSGTAGTPAVYDIKVSVTDGEYDINDQFTLSVYARVDEEFAITGNDPWPA